MPPQREVKPPHLLQRRSVDLYVLGMHVEQPVFERCERPERVHVLQHKMRGVVVEPQRGRSDISKCAPPDSRRGEQVLSARPLIPGEQHRAVFNTDPHAQFLGQSDDRLPGLEEPRPVVIDRPRPVTAHKPGDRPQAEQGGRRNDLSEVCRCGIRNRRVRVEHVWVVAEPTDADAVPRAGRQDVLSASLRERTHVDMCDAGVLPLGGANGPAHELDGGEAL